MSEEFDAIDELGKATNMPPKSTRDVLIVDPECIERLRTMLAELRETTLDGLPHSEPGECPTWYDKCNCTVENLQHNIKRADEAEAENARLREAIDSAIETWDSNAPGRGLTERQALRKLHAASNNG